MYKCTMQRRFVTLIEMMIVMFLIALIAGALAYNYQGSLDEGKAFKTKTDIEKLETILNLEISKHPQATDDVINNWQEVIRRAPLVKNPNSLIMDGWGDLYDVRLDPERGGVRVTSKKYDEYRMHNNTMIRQ